MPDAYGNEVINGVLTDPKTGNQFINGVWRSPQGGIFQNGVWINPGAPTQQQQYGGTGNINIPQGWGYQNQIQQFGFTGQQNQLNRDYEMKGQQIQIDAQKYLADRQAQLQQSLQQGQIDARRYEAELDRAARESEFARTLAMNKLELEHRMQIDRGNLELEERQLEASLGANPINFVMNELFKRGRTPGVLPQGAQQNVTAAAGAAGGDPNISSQATAATSATSGGQPAYDDATLAGIANDLFSTGMGGSFYNPRLGGTGIFGANIRSPNEVSRAESLGMSDTERNIFNSFLTAGIDMGGGGRNSIIPEEWWTQQQNSLVPTLDRSSSRTSYIV